MGDWVVAPVTAQLTNQSMQSPIPPASHRFQNSDRFALAAILLLGFVLAFLTSATAQFGVAYWLGAAGLIAVYERLRPEFPRSVAFLTTLLLGAGTSLFWFMVRSPAPALMAAFAALAIVAAMGYRWTHDRSPAYQAAAAALITALAGAIAYVVARAAGGEVRAASWTDLLFSSSHGFLSWSPVAYVAAVGSIAYAVRRVAWSAAAVVTLVAVALVGSNAATLPFGGVLLIALALLAPGLAFAIDAVRARPLLATLPLAAAVLWWNYLLMAQYTVGLVPKDEPVSFANTVRQQADVHVQQARFYPFAFPMNVWFAYREGLPIDRYDLLAGERVEASIDLMLDRRADRFLLDGWDAPGADQGAPSWWLGGTRATLAVPVSVPSGRDVAVTVVTRARFEEPVVEADVGLEINGHEVGRFVSSPHAPAASTFRIPAATVGRILRAGYNHVTFVSRGVRRVDPTDTRPPGPLASRTGNRAWPVAVYRVTIAAE